jgi:DNA segregation ATPase FtsK/SpoIIIE-like protein
MTKKQKNYQSFWTQELKSMVAGWVLGFFCVLIFIGDTKSIVGSNLASAMTAIFGQYYAAICILYAVLALGLIVGKLHWNSARIIGILLYGITMTTLVATRAPYKNHGILDFSDILRTWLGELPMILACIGGVLISVFLMLRISYRQVIAAVQSKLPTAASVRESMTAIARDIPTTRALKWVQKSQNDRTKELDHELELARAARQKESDTSVDEPLIGKLLSSLKWSPESKTLIKPSEMGTQKVTIQKKTNGGFAGIFSKTTESSDPKAPDFGSWEFPSTHLLNEVTHRVTVTPAEIREKSLEIERTLAQFKIGVDMAWEKVGPTVVQYRLEPHDGVKLSKIEGLKKDLTLALKAKSVRIQAPIPGLGLVGIEVPNDKRDMIGIREVLEHPNFTHSKATLALAVGKDINGDYIVGDLAKMPHLLIAGQTGSGKSVGMNGFLVSLLYKNSPTHLRMILIDPKRVELGIYNGIPHLLTPVINEPDKALNALKWSVAEMIRRYDILNMSKVRNLAEYNAKVTRKDRMPNIVIVIDELADLMMSGNKKEVETTIARIAQMARAVGMHLIVATQRPSVDVITGLIKANIPSRIAFTVASLIDSRTILDRMGAEDLLGNGDMLYAPAGSMAPERIQGVYVSTEEVESVVNHIKRTIDPEMLEDIYDASIVETDKGNWTGSAGGGGAEGYDEDPKVLDEAAAFVRAAGKASTSMLQRRMKLGYARAARVMDILEEMGIVGPADGSKPREVIG